MIAFGPHVRYPDPRVYDLTAQYGWGPSLRELLLGVRPWPDDAPQGVLSVVGCLRDRGIRVEFSASGIAYIHMDGLPPPDPLLPDLMAQWRVEIPWVSVLSLEGPVDVVGGVPILRGTVFGRTERSNGRRYDGLHRDAWVIGRGDVLQTYRRDDGVAPWYGHAGGPVVGRDGVRGTLARARNTARTVAAALADWEAWSVWRAERDRRAAEDERQAVEAAGEPEDEGVVGFAA